MSRQNESGYIVKVSESALISMTLNAIEAYSVEHMNIEDRNNVRLETFGNLFGHEFVHSSGKTIYSVELVNTDTSALQEEDGVEYNDEAIQLKSSIISSFWPNYKYLGDLHTHPYRTHLEVRAKEGYYLSPGDRKDLSGRTKFWKGLGHRLSLLVAVGAMKRAGTKRSWWINSHHNSVEYTLGNFRLWLTAYTSYYDEIKEKLLFTKDNDPLVRLDCTSLTGLSFEWERFRKK